MKKKFLALVLTLAMVLSLVPVTALAMDGTDGGASQKVTKDNLTMTKTVTPVQNKDGTYTVRLESYAEGKVTTTTTTKQMDIVLLLDVSGSMGDQFTQDIEEYQPVYKDSLDTSKTYLVKQGWWYEEVTYCPTCKEWTRGCRDSWWTGNHREGKIFTPTETENDTNNKHTQFYQYVYISGQNKMDALKTAVNQFIEGIAKNSPQSNISIVKFAGEMTESIGNETYGTGNDKENYTQIVEKLTTVGDGGADQLKQAVSRLTAAGATASDYGLEKAKEALKDATKDKVVVLFTDGEPNHYNGFDYEVATNAVNTAKTLKQDNTTIYTVGVFKNPDNDINLYMSSVSSNYPNATAEYKEGSWVENDTWTVRDGGPDPGTYYKTADSADDLIKAFQTISSQVSSTNLNGNAVVVDKVPSNFKAPANAKDVTLKVANYKADGTFGTETAAPSTIHASVNTDGTVSVTGFDFSQNWCGVKADNTTPTGKKLIIEFTISRTNYGGTQRTNAGAYIKASKEANEKPIISLKDPEVPVTISLGIPEAELNKKLGVSSQKEYDGSGIFILSELSAKANALVDGTNNAYVDMELTIAVDEANTYVYRIQAGKQSGDWYQNNQKMTPEAVSNVKTSQNVNRGENNAVESYIYNFDLKLSDATPRGADPAEYQNNTASFKITPRNVTLTSATDSKEYDGNPLTNDKITEGSDGFVKGEGATYAVTGSQTTVGESNNTFNYTLNNNTKASNYTITTELGKLTITKKAEVLYTLIFDPNGGAWSDTTFNGYTVSEGKASRSGVLGTERITSTSITAPTNQGKVLDGWGYYDNENLIKISNLDLPSSFAPTVEQLYNEYGQKPTNTVTLYAIWKDDTTSADSLTYTIKQHYIRSEQDADHVEIKDLPNEQGEQEIKISELIKDKAKNLDWRDGRGSLNHYVYAASETTVTVPGQTAQPYNTNDTLRVTGTVIDLYYYLDDWKDADETTASDDEDSATGGDGIPDCQQVKIQYLAYEKNGGNVSRQVEIATFDNDTLNAIHGSTATANSGFTFVTWSGKNVEVNSFTVNNVIATTDPKSGPECKPSSTELVKGNAYTYTAIFLEDKIGGGDNKDQPDGIPDRYQVTINYVSSDTSKGSVGTLTKEVLTIYENGKEGKWASKGKVVASGSTANATGSRCYFSNWTNTAGLAPSYNATLGQQTIENAEGGKTYTFTANFGRSSGGSNRPKPPVVEIPDDVPTGLNGKDHYAYVVGYPDGMVYPQKNITRAEVATIFFRLLKDETREANMTKSNSYNDMKDGAWYTCAVSTLSKMGIIKGYEDGSFKPDASISRAEFAAIAARFDPDGDKTPATFSDVSSHWAKDEISIAANHGWIKGYEDGSFKPDQKITRAETMTLVNRVLKRLPETKDDLHKDMKTWPDNQKESAWFYLAVQEATNSHYQKLKKDGTHETWESMRETRDWAALEK